MKDTLALFGGPPAFAPRPEYLPVTGAERAAVDRSLQHTPLTTLFGDGDVARFEEAFASYFGAPHAVAMTSGTASLHAAMAALGVGPGDEVITPTYSFVASASVVAQQGARPVFCDIDAGTLDISVADCARRITRRTKAVVAVHIYGNPAELVALRELCDGAGIALVEDCAGAAGARVGDRFVGTFGDIGCFSFNLYKVIRTGEGGMATTGDAELAEALRELRVNGINRHGRGANGVSRLGFNYTMPQPIAALGCEQMTMLDELLARRARNLRALHDACRELDLPLEPLPPRAGVTPVGYWTPLLLPPALAPLRATIIRAVRAEGVLMHDGYGRPLPEIDYLKPFAAGEFPVTAAVAPRVVVVDPSPWLAAEDMRAAAAAMRKVFDHLDRLRGEAS